MTRSTLVLAALAFGLAAGVGVATWWGATSTPDEPTVDEASDDDRPGRRRRRRRATDVTEAGPLTDPDDNTGVTPPAAQLGHVAPTPLGAAAPTGRPVEAPTAPMNVVVVLGCTVRKDQVTPYGGHPQATPFLQDLADDGVVFDDLIAAAPWTRAASTALLTGQHAVHVGMVEPSPRRNDRRLPDTVTTLGEHFQRAGYLTLGATANPNLSRTFGFHQGYDRYQLGLPDQWGAKLSGKEIARAVAGALADARDGGDDRPVFVRVMMLDAHAPRTARGAQLEPFAEPGVPARVLQYRYHLREFDDAVRALWEGLGEQGLDASNTLLVVTADHGEGMNYPDHHGFGHGQYFGSSTVHVPWIVHGLGASRGHTILGPASQVDLVPTLLSLAGLPAPEATDGRDWSALVRGEGRAIDRERVYSDTWFGGSRRAAVFTPDHQCQADFGSTEKQQVKGKFVPGCYDRHADPLFTSPLEQPELLADLQAWRTRAEAGLDDLDQTDAEVDDDLARQLQVLGYVDEDEEEE